MPLKDFTVIAEIGVNHEGDFEQAKKILHLAADAGADFVKFQSYSPEKFVAANNQERLERVTRFGLSEEQFKLLSQEAAAHSVHFISTPVTEDWVGKLNPYCPLFKIASGDIDFKPVIQAAAETGKTVILSTGASSIEEVDQAVAWVRDIVGEENLYDRLILLHCVASYPTPIEQANVLSVPFMKERYGLRVGFSNHIIGMDACLAAVALGADVIEVHFTDQKENRDFHDHALSFDPLDLKKFIEQAQNIRASLGAFEKKRQPCEENFLPMRKGVVAAKTLKAGDILSIENLAFARPANEFSAKDIDDLIGKKINSDIPEGFLIPKDAV